MAENNPKVMSWAEIIGILLATGLVVGLTIGMVTTALDLPWRNGGAGIGAAVGILGAVLIQRRRAALAQQNKG